MAIDFGDILASSVNAMTPDLDSLYAGTKHYSIEDWELQQRALVTGSGAAVVAIPGVHLAGLAAEFAFVVNRMGVTSYGVGAIKTPADMENPLEREDFIGILKYWAGEEDFMELMKGKGAADLSTKVGVKLVTKVGGKLALSGLAPALMSTGGYMIAKKVGAKTLAKPAAKFAAKYAGKALGGFVPILGPIVGGAVNLWLISSIIDASKSYYQDKFQLIYRLA